MRTFLAWLAILGFLPVALRLMLNGTLSVEMGVGLLVLVVLSIAIGVKPMKVIIPIAGIVIFAAQFSGGDTNTLWANVSAIFALSLALLGFYFMFSGIFGSRRRNRDD